jgi:hypothetical protein
MPAIQFNRESWAKEYAEAHLKTDPGISTIYYLPTGADEREIRFVEVNQMITSRTDEALEPLDFGIDMGTETAHKLFVLDVTPDQWQRMQDRDLALPEGWSLEGAIEFTL